MTDLRHFGNVFMCLNSEELSLVSQRSSWNYIHGDHDNSVCGIGLIFLQVSLGEEKTRKDLGVITNKMTHG